MSFIKLDTTLELIDNFKGNVPVGTLMETLGYASVGDGGGAKFLVEESGYVALVGDVTLPSGLVAKLLSTGEVASYDTFTSAVTRSDGLKGTTAVTAGVFVNDKTELDVDYTLSVADSTTTVGFTPRAPLVLKGLYDGTTTQLAGVRNHTAHLVGYGSTSADGVSIKDAEITGWTFPILKANTTGGDHGLIRVSDSYFHDNYGVDALFNSPASGSTMNNIVVSNNFFGDNIAEDIGGFSHRISMAGHVENFVVTGNVAFGAGNEIWRAEEAARNGVVIGNAAQLGDRHGIEVTDNNVGGVALTPSNLIITNNALEGKNTVGSRGLHYTFDGSGVHPIEKSICGGNILSNWETGVRLARKASLNDNTGNVINDCAIGVLAQEPTLTLDNTTMVDVTTKLDADSGGLFGKIHLRDTTSDTPLFTNMVAAAGNPAAITGWTYESQLFSTAATANNYIPVIELGDSFHLDVKIYFGREAGNFSFVRGIIEYDGTTLVFTQSHRNQLGSLVLSGAPFRANAGNLEVNIFAGTPAIYSGCRIQISTEGLHVFA